MTDLTPEAQKNRLALYGKVHFFVCVERAERKARLQPRQLRPFRDHGTRPKGRVNESAASRRTGKGICTRRTRQE